MAIDPDPELVGRAAGAATRLAIRPAAIARKLLATHLVVPPS